MRKRSDGENSGGEGREGVGSDSSGGDSGDGGGGGGNDGDGRASGRTFRPAHPTERAVGIEHYVSDVDGVGGRLRARPEDFRVREIERIEPEPLDADPDAYPHVVLRATLRDWDTNDFASVLSDRLGISRERIQWAGTKDKRAVTTQLFSVDRVDPGTIPGVADADQNGTEGDADDSPAIGGATIEVVGRLGRAVELGDLAGNEFVVSVADAQRPENLDPITASLAAFGRDEDVGTVGSSASGSAGGSSDDRSAGGSSDDGSDTDDESVSIGLPNYFGQQRFGSRRPITHEVGLAIVRRDWREAVRIYVVEDHAGEPASTREARRAAGDCFDDRDFRGALDALPDRLGYERSLCHALIEQEGESSSAASDGPTPDYRDALDVLPWNLQRLFVHAAQSYAFNRILSERADRGLPFARPVAGDVACFADTSAPAGLALPDTDRLQRVDEGRVDTVSRHCERGRAFVTAPLVGTETDLGDGEPGEIERAVLDDLDLEPDDFDLPEPFHSTGTRRAILVETDLTITSGDGASADGPETASDPTFEFALPKGSYATVVLREYLKVDPVDLG